MQMQKFELETAAALKANQLQERTFEYSAEEAVVTLAELPQSSMITEQTFNMVELDPNDFCEGSEFVQDEPMPNINNTDYKVLSYSEIDALDSIEVPQFPLDNAKVVVVENNSSQPFYF